MKSALTAKTESAFGTGDFDVAFVSWNTNRLSATLATKIFVVWTILQMLCTFFAFILERIIKRKPFLIFALAFVDIFGKCPVNSENKRYPGDDIQKRYLNKKCDDG